MSGTSMDGIDCSYVETNGQDFIRIKNEKSYSYSNNYIKKLKKIIKDLNYSKKSNYKDYININETFITKKFIQIIKKFINEFEIKNSKIDYISLSGQTVFHNPKIKKTIQLGNCREIQKKLKIKIIGNLRNNDIKNGGQGAPIGAFYHKYILKNFSKSTAIINLGGIANISFLKNNKIIAFDLGPGNCLINDLMLYFYKKNYDKDGRFAKFGKKNIKILNAYINDDFFKLSYPKSLDREYFSKYFNLLKKIKNSDSIKTASLMTVECIFITIKKIINRKIKTIILTGGGRKNLFIFKNLEKKYKVINIDDLNYNGDFLESQAFAYIGVRSVLNLPLSIPSTTGVKKPTTGGEIFC